MGKFQTLLGELGWSDLGRDTTSGGLKANNTTTHGRNPD
jgi:hypothetical protein